MNRHSIAHSISSFERPYATLLDAQGHAVKYSMLHSKAQTPPTHLLQLLRYLDIEGELQDLASDAASLSVDMTSWLDDPKCILDPVQLQTHGFLLLQRCLAFLSTSSSTIQPLDHSLCLAILIFVVRITQPADYSFHAMATASVPRLRVALKKAPVSEWANAPDVLLWILTIGSLAAQGTQHFDFFAQTSAAAFASADIDETTSRDKLMARMKSILWLDSLMDAPARKLWTQLGVTKSPDSIHFVEEEEDQKTGVTGPLTPDDKDEAAVGRLTSTRFFT